MTLLPEPFRVGFDTSQQYETSSADRGPGSREFSKQAHPRSVWFRRLIYYIAVVDFALMRRDAKRVAELDIEGIIPCHGDIIETGGAEAWASAYQWYLQGDSRPGFARQLIDLIMFMRLIRWMLLM